MGDLMSVIEYWEDVKGWAEDLNIDIERAIRNPTNHEEWDYETDGMGSKSRVDYDNIEDYFQTAREFEKWFKTRLLQMKKALGEYRGNIPLDPYYEKSLITLVDNFHTFPKVEDDTKALEMWLKRYDDMVHTLQIEFMNELNKMAAPHKGGTIETAFINYKPDLSRSRGIDAFMKGLKELASSVENKKDPDLDVLKMMVEPIPVNVFQRKKEGKSHDTISFTTNSNEMRAIRKFLEKVRVYRNEISQPRQRGDSPKWKYDETGNLQRIEVDKRDTALLDRFIKLFHNTGALLERSKHKQFTKIVDSDMPITISLKKHYLLDKSLGTKTTNDETRKSGEIVLNKYINPKMAHAYFSENENLTKEGLKHKLERGITIYLPHLHTSIRNTMPRHFPSDEVVEILSEALINYENKLHIKYVEGEFSNVFSKINFTNINTRGVESKKEEVPQFRDADRNLDADAPWRD